MLGIDIGWRPCLNESLAVFEEDRRGAIAAGRKDIKLGQAIEQQLEPVAGWARSRSFAFGVPLLVAGQQCSREEPSSLEIRVAVRTARQASSRTRRGINPIGFPAGQTAVVTGLTGF